MMDGQVRIGPAGGVIGWDMTAALAMARATGLSGPIALELLATAEAVAVQQINARSDGSE